MCLKIGSCGEYLGRRVHNEELYSLYHSPNIVRVITSRRLKWAGYAARMEEGRNAVNILRKTWALY